MLDRMLRASVGLLVARILLLGLALGPLLPAPALAQAPSPCDTSTDPKRLVEEGLRLYKAAFAQGPGPVARAQYEQALRCYERAMDNSRSPAKIYHPLGLVYEKLDRPEDALDAFERFLGEVPESERSPQVSQKLRERVEVLRAQLAARRAPEVRPAQPAAPAAVPLPSANLTPRLGETRREPRMGLVIAGASIAGGAYLISLIGGVVCSSIDGYICGTQAWGWYVPIIGPFIAMSSYYTGNDDYAAVEAVLAIDGLLQAGGVTMAILGAVLKRPVPRLSALPLPGGAGLSWAGSF